MIRFKNVGFEYESGTTALTDVSVEFDNSCLTSVVGPNGCGKSTMARLMMGLLLPSTGSVEVDGYDTRSAPANLIRSLVGLAWQNPDNQLVCGVVEDDIAFGPENLGLRIPEVNRRVDEVIERLALNDVRSLSIHTLSSAQKQVVAVAGAMAIEPRYLILDEVTSRLDPVAAHVLLDAVAEWARDHKVGVIMITHLMAEVLRSDSVCRFAASPEGGGQIAVTGSPDAILREAMNSDEVVLETPLYDMLFRLGELGVRLDRMPETVAGLVDQLCP